MHRLGPFAGLQHEIESQSNNVFVIRGSRLLGTEDADAHAAVEQCLVPWMGDEGNLMDRYDARMLLDDLSSFASSVRHGNSRSAEADLGATAEELCNERYADLDPSKEHLLATSGLPLHSGDEAELADDSKHCPDTTEHEHQGPAFALDYGSTGEQAAKPTTVAAAGPRPPLLPPTEDSRPATSIADHAAQYLPPYEHVPEQLADHLPKSQRQHQIIAQTAKFVRGNGNQVEVLLRVKHGANPNFAFLMKHDRLFPYYRWLVEQAPQEFTAQPQTPASQQQQQNDGRQPEHAEQQDQQQEGDQPSSSQAAALAALPAPESVAAAVDGGALELLRLYSMNNEADSDVAGSSGQQQQQQQEAAEQTVEALSHGASQVVFGPALPPGFPAAADTAAAGDSPAASPVQQGPQEDSPQAGPSPPQQQQQQPASPTRPTSDVSAGCDPGSPGCQAPAAPPDTVRAIIDKLVAFVKKNGIKFERVVRSREQNNPRFAFLHPGSMHHTYYQQQLQDAVGPSAVRELFDNIKQQAQQPAEGIALGPHSEAAATGAASIIKVVLKANPPLVPKRPLAPQATAVVEVVATDDNAGSPKPATSSFDHQPMDVACNSPALDTEPHPAPGASFTAAAEPPGDSAASVQQQHLQPAAASSDRPTATAATVVVDASHATSSAETQAQKRLRLRMYLRQRRAEQLAEEQQQEHDTKARAILSHRQLLKRAAAGADDSDRNSAGDVGSQPGEEQDQQQEVEEGEIPEDHDLLPASGSKLLPADTAARAAAMRLLQRSPEPVDTTLPGLKELASSAAAAAAKHRAALMVNSDDESLADDGPGDKQRQMLAAALKVAHKAAAAAGVGAAADLPAAAAPVGTSVSDVAAQPVGAVGNMAAAANAAAAVIAAQAAGVSVMLVQPQLVMPALLQQSDTAAALTAATSGAAAAAAAAARKQQPDSAAASGHSASTSHSTQASSSSDSGENSSGNGSAERLSKHRRSGSRPGDRAASRSPSSSRSRSRSKTRRKPTERRRSSRPNSTLRRGDGSDHWHNSSRHTEHKHSGQRLDKSKSRSRHQSSHDKRSKRSRSPKAEKDRGRSHKQGKHMKHMVPSRSKHRHRDASTPSRSCSGNDDRPVAHQGMSSAAVTAATAATQPATQPLIAATAPGSIPLAGLPALDSEQLRQRLRQMMGNIS